MAGAVLVFAVPASPMFQPWSAIGGNTLSALLGIAAVHGLQCVVPREWVAALDVAGAIGLMVTLRCLRPPGGASALMMVLGGMTHPAFGFYPVILNSFFLVIAGIAHNNATGRAYPHMQLVVPGKGVAGETRELDADLDAVLLHYNQVLDVSRDDLKTLRAGIQLRAYDRKLSEVTCADIMSRDLVTG